MKKLLFITNHMEFSNGVASVLTELVNALDKQLFEVSVLPLFNADAEFLKKLDSDVKILKGYGKYFRGFAKLLKLIPARSLYKKFVKEQYDAEIAFNLETPMRIVAASKNRKAVKLSWIHGYDEVNKKYFEQSDYVVCCAESTADRYLSKTKYPEKYRTVYNIIKDEKVFLGAKEPIEVEKKHEFTFCTAGRLSPEKGFFRLLQCHKRLMDEGYHSNLWIVGDGKEYERLQSFVKSNCLEESVKLLGFDKNPFKYMQNCDAFVCSSFGEGFSTVCTEAAILGKPIITTLVGGAEELSRLCGAMVVKGVTSSEELNQELTCGKDSGFYEGGSTQALYEGMKKVLTDKAFTDDFIGQAQASAASVSYDTRRGQAQQFFIDLFKEV